MNINFNKTPDNLIPAIIQDSETKNVLMLGYMNQEALDPEKSGVFGEQILNNFLNL